MKKLWIDQLSSGLGDLLPEGLEPENTSGLAPDPGRIKELTMKKLAQQRRLQTGPGEEAPPPAAGKEKPMKKNTVRIILAAAVVCLLSVTALALGGADFFQAIFGREALSVQDQIETPMASAENGDYRLSAVASLSDGYKTNLVLSLESLRGDGSQKDAQGRIGAMTAAESASVACTPLPEFDSGGISYYRLEVPTLQSHAGEAITAVLEGEEGEAPLLLEVAPEKRLAALTVEIPEEAFAGENYRPEEVQLSPLGVLVIGAEEEAQGGIPNVQILAVLEDGSQVEIMPLWAFDSGSGGSTAVAGGGAVEAAPWEEEPLVVHTSGARNLDGKTVTTANFTRVFPVDQVTAIIVNGISFSL